MAAMSDRMQKSKSGVGVHLAAAGWTLLVLLLLLMPGSRVPNPGDALPFGLPAWFDKVVHGTLFFFEALLLDRSWRRLPRFSRPLLAALAAAAGLGVATELLQVLIPARGLEFGDLLANLGAVTLYGLAVTRYAVGRKSG